MSVNNIFRLLPLWKENVNVAVKAIKSNRLRSFFTIIIIATGIASLVGILTAIEAVKVEVFSNFERMGVTAFSITYKKLSAEILVGRERTKNPNIISYHQASLFKERFKASGIVSIFAVKDGISVKSGNRTIENPITLAVAADENYLTYRRCELDRGRAFVKSDIDLSKPVCILGYEVANSLFKNGNPIGKEISLAGASYVVVGTIRKTGGVFGGSADNEIILPLTNIRGNLLSDEVSFTIGISPVGDLDDVYNYSEHLFRTVRRLAPADRSDFSMNRSDVIIEEMLEMAEVITIAAFVIGFITLFGAATGLMNIMLASVRERRREIGVRKAVGASCSNVKIQFLIEAAVISLFGCIFGIAAGILSGNAVALFLGASFIMPWSWMLLAVVVCLITGVVSGYVPAVKAAALDPIEALRWE